MSRVAVSKEMTAYIEARITGFPTEAEERRQWLAPYIAEFGALPLYLGWSESIGIRPDGELVSWSTEGDYAGIKPVEDRTWVISALVAGSERYPELRKLLPDRESGAVDCSCATHPLITSGRVICGECGGVGWLPRKTVE